MRPSSIYLAVPQRRHYLMSQRVMPSSNRHRSDDKKLAHTSATGNAGVVLALVRNKLNGLSSG